MAKKFSPKDPEEIYTLGFDFTDVLLEGETLSTATLAVDLQSGTTDPAMNTMLMGGANITGAVVAQQLRYGVAGNVYRIDCLTTTSEGNKYMLNATLSIVEKNP